MYNESNDVLGSCFTIRKKYNGDDITIENLSNLLYDKIIEHRQELIKEGIYFLMNGDKIVYIGESKCIMKRIGDHYSSKRDFVEFDSFFIESMSESSSKERQEKEAKYIALFNPKHNKNHSKKEE